MMGGRELKPLKLPQLVEARTQETEDLSMASPISVDHRQQSSQASTNPDASSTTPNPTNRSMARSAGSPTSLPSSPNLRESLDVFGTAKRPLTDVKEEPLERDDDLEMVDAVPTHRGFSHSSSIRSPSEEWTHDDHDLRFLEYDLADDSEPPQNPAPKRQRGDASGLESIANKINAIKPSLSRKWKSRKASPTTGLTSLSREPSLSRANSTRAPSFSSTNMEGGKTHSLQLPPTPTRTTWDESLEESFHSLENHIRSSTVEGLDREEDQAKPTTPLLPPLMTSIIPAHLQEIPYQSPLQSPSVADPETASNYHSPLPTPQITSLPSPPLSSRPSVASFKRHHSQRGRSGHPHNSNPQIIPSAEIPPHPLDPPQDEWADKLGHANFHILPEPYCPTHPSALACDRLRNDWAVARQAFREHLTQVGEHYGPTSTIYLLTEEKWSEINAIWKRNLEACIAAEAITGNDGIDYGQPAVGDPALSSNPALVIPAASACLGSLTASNAPSPAHVDSPAHSIPSPIPPKQPLSIDISPVVMTPSPTSPLAGSIANTQTVQPRHSPQQTPILSKNAAKFPTPGEGGIVGPMEVVASRRVLDAHLDRSEAAEGDLVSPNNARGQIFGSSRRKRKWGAVFNFRWMMEKFTGEGASRSAKA